MRNKGCSALRIHKSYHVNPNHVAEVAKGLSGTYFVIMNVLASIHLSVSRQYGKRLRDLLRGSKH
jgi:DNA-binding LytR/AlgR family response regulator